MSHKAIVDDHDYCHHRYQHHLEHYRNGLSNDEEDGDHNDVKPRTGRNMGSDSDIIKPSGVEQILIDSWLNLCPSLEVVTLFSGSQWRKELDDRREL